MDLNGIRWATSFGDIERAVVYPGTAALFMYTEEDAFAIKTVDSRGYATISEYDFTRRKPRAPKGFVSQEDYDKLRKELEDAQSALLAAQAADTGGHDGSGEELQGDTGGCEEPGLAA